MIKHDTLYKRTSSGKIQIWYMEQSGFRYRSTSGQLEGKKTTTEWTVARAKNVDRANETTPEQQAYLEIIAEYDKKLARDYHRSADAVDRAMRFKPMLATKWADVGPKLSVNDSLFMQGKLDGVRIIAKADGLWTREGKPIYGAPHIFEALKPVFEKFPDTIIDGEGYNHKLRYDFNKIVSCIKKQKPTEHELRTSRENIQYWMYDLPSHDDTFIGRYAKLQHLWLNVANRNESLVLVDTIPVSLDDVDAKAADYIELGYEGAMIRTPGKYENKRSKNLIKWKEFQDAEFEILDIQEGDGNRSGMAARVILDLGNSKTFSAGIIGNVDYCKQLLEERDQHIGKMGTVVYQNLTPDGVPRFPKFKCVRNYE